MALQFQISQRRPSPTSCTCRSIGRCFCGSPPRTFPRPVHSRFPRAAERRAGPHHLSLVRADRANHRQGPRDGRGRLLSRLLHAILRRRPLRDARQGLRAEQGGLRQEALPKRPTSSSTTPPTSRCPTPRSARSSTPATAPSATPSTAAWAPGRPGRGSTSRTSSSPPPTCPALRSPKATTTRNGTPISWNRSSIPEAKIVQVPRTYAVAGEQFQRFARRPAAEALRDHRRDSQAGKETSTTRKRS